MKGKSARDLESEEMFDIVLDSMSFDFGLIAWEGDVVNPDYYGNIREWERGCCFDIRETLKQDQRSC